MRVIIIPTNHITITTKHYNIYSVNNTQQVIHPSAANTKNKLHQTHKPPTNPFLVNSLIV